METKAQRLPMASSIAVQHVMAANRGRDTGPELRLRMAIVHLSLVGFRLNYRVGRRRIDIAFPSYKLAVFVHGCFWHHCPTCSPSLPKTHSTYWKEKFERNAERDRLVKGELEALGWQVVEVWEHEIRKDSDGAAMRVKGLLEKGLSN